MAPKTPTKKPAQANKNFKDTAGAVPKPIEQEKPEVAQPLLSKEVEKSDAATSPPPAAPGSPAPPASLDKAGRAARTSYAVAESPIISSSAVLDDDDDTRGMCCSCVRPACCTVLVLVGLALSYSAGYMTREHQADAAQDRVTELEKALGIYSTIEDIPAAISTMETAGMLAWFLGRDGEGPVDGGLYDTCPDGLLVGGPMQTPAMTLTFLCLLLWAFIGVAIGADLFMESIEQITSQEQTQKVALPNGMTRYVTVRVWNATIANLTLMALGSSAPEILLSVIEIFGNDFYAGALGPSTIVGSAAFNLMVISAVCVVAIPGGDGRYIKDRGVFYITATFSIFAYMWLYFILIIATPNIVTIAEGVTTLLFFPILLQLAYWADQGLFSGCALPSCCSGRSRIGVARKRLVELSGDGAAKESSKLSRAAYRINATRAATGAATREAKAERLEELLVDKVVGRLASKAVQHGVFELGSTKVSVTDNDRWAEIKVFRYGNVLPPASVGYTCTCAFTTSDEAADAIAAEGTVAFGPGQQAASLRLEVLPEDKQKAGGGSIFDVSISAPSPGNELGVVTQCAVRVVSEASAGVFTLAEDHVEVSETGKQALITLRRVDGSKGVVSCTVSTQDGKAVAPHDYLPLKSELIEFADGVLERTVAVRIVDDNNYEGDEDFKVIFEDAQGGAIFSADGNGGPSRALATVVILCDDKASSGCEALCVGMGLNADQLALVGMTWSNQFEEAVRYEGYPSCVGVFMYLLALPWRLIFAFAPPPRLGGGWTAFVVVLGMIGVLTAIIGDLAAHLGCCLHIAASTTAITFVALGTSLPDTFASKAAAVNEEHADSSIGNITGSNSVNVFLGLGLPWALAAIYWAVWGSLNEDAWRARYLSEDWYSPSVPVGFAVPAGDLGFSVGVFVFCGCCTLFLLLLRRAVLGFELGGPPIFASVSGGIMVALWFIYVGVSVWHTSTS